MFNKHHETKITLAVLFIGWLTLGFPTATLAADSEDARTPPAQEEPRGWADRGGSEVGEPQAPPAAQPRARVAASGDDDGVDEPPPDPLAGPGWLVDLLARLLTWRFR